MLLSIPRSARKEDGNHLPQLHQVCVLQCCCKRRVKFSCTSTDTNTAGWSSKIVQEETKVPVGTVDLLTEFLYASLSFSRRRDAILQGVRGKVFGHVFGLTFARFVRVLPNGCELCKLTGAARRAHFSPPLYLRI